MKMSPVSRALSDAFSDCGSGMTNPNPSRRVQRLRIRNDEPEPVAMHAEPPRDKILVSRSLWKSVAIRTERQKRAAGDQLLQAVIQFAAFLSMQSQFAHQLLESGRALGLPGDVFENGRIREHEAVSHQLSA